MALLPIQIPRIWVALKHRFNLSSSVPGTLYIEEKPKVQVVMDISRLLGNTQFPAVAVLDLSVALGTFVSAFTVPEGKEWTMFYTKRTATSTNSKIVVSLDGVNNAYSAAGTSEEFIRSSIIMPPGMQIGMNGTGDAGDTTRGLVIAYTEVDAQ